MGEEDTIEVGVGTMQKTTELSVEREGKGKGTRRLIMTGMRLETKAMTLRYCLVCGRQVLWIGHILHDSMLLVQRCHE